VAEEGRGENEVVQPANPAANAAANASANLAANAPANAPANGAGNAANNAANAANIQGTPPQIQDTMQELSLLRSRPIVRKEVSVTA
jgi:hypothetical protein